MMSSNITNVTELLLVCHGVRFLVHKESSVIFWHVVSAISLNTIIGTFSAISNLLMIFVVWRNRQLQTRTNILFTYLAVTDVLVGIFAFPLSAIVRIYQAKGIHSCSLGIAWGFSAYLLCFWSAFTVCIIGVDRFVATFYPMTYRRMDYPWKRNCTLFTLWFCWCFFLVVVYSRVVSFLVFNITLLIFIVTGLSTGVFCYIKIVYKLRENSLATNALKRKFHNNLVKRRCSTAGLITVALLVTYFPRLIVTVMHFFDEKKNFEFIYLSGVWSESLVFSNSAINPMLYFWRLKNVRSAVLEIFPKLKTGMRSQAYNAQIELPVRKERYIQNTPL